jgi:excisionase family DNA binding protein
MEHTRPYLTVDDLARLCRRSKRTIYRWLAAEIVPSFRIAGTRLVDVSDLEQVIARARAEERHGAQP